MQQKQSRGGRRGWDRPQRTAFATPGACAAVAVAEADPHLRGCRVVLGREVCEHVQKSAK